MLNDIKIYQTYSIGARRFISEIRIPPNKEIRRIDPASCTAPRSEESIQDRQNQLEANQQEDGAALFFGHKLLEDSGQWGIKLKEQSH